MSWSRNAYLVFLAALALERLFELRLSRRNREWALARGGVEYGAAHFPLMKALHAGFFAACALEVVLLGRTFVPVLGVPMLGVALAAQALRYWAIATLGRRWNVRVVVVPDLPVETGGPYRYMRHPNYLAVVAEGIAVPLVHSAWLTAAGFTALNAWMLRVRIRCEERALSEHADYAARLGPKRRFLPTRFS